jgi:hypothetical protein
MVLLGVDKLTVARTESIGISRQESSSPVVVISFEKPQRDVFQIKVGLPPGGSLSLKRVSPMCSLCNEQHTISNRLQMVQERIITPPNSNSPCYNQRIQTPANGLRTLLDVRPRFSLSDQIHCKAIEEGDK